MVSSSNGVGLGGRFPFEKVAWSLKSAKFGNNAVANYSRLLNHTVNSDVCCRMINCLIANVK